MSSPYLYLWLMAASAAYPLAQSFEHRLQYYKSFGRLGLAILGGMLLFIPWDIWFATRGVWGFNIQYTAGGYLLGLPLGEWLFFIVIPFACIFIYRVLNYFVKRDVLANYKLTISRFLLTFSVALAIIHFEKAYTFWTFALLAALLALHLGLKRAYMSRFYLAYAVVLIPFFIINGILTGTGIEGEVVWYNNNENMGIRLLTIPAEDIFYGMLLVMLNVTIYEELKGRFGFPEPKAADRPAQ